MLRYVALLMFALALLVVPATPAAAAPPGPSIVDVAIAINSETGEFSTLIAAVLAADPAVLKTLAGKGQHTVFAPTDAAFAELGLNADNIGSALDQATLTNILLYHVAPGRRDSGQVLAAQRINTLLRRNFLFQSGGVLTDNQGRSANIVATDVAAANGLIHVIDRVVLP